MSIVEKRKVTMIPATIVCYKCKQRPAVIDRLVMTVLERGYAFECMSCFVKDKNKELEEQKEINRVLKNIIIESLRR